MISKVSTVGAPLLPAVCKFFTPFFTAVYIVERLVTIHVLNKQNLKFWDLKSVVYSFKSRAGYNGARTVDTKFPLHNQSEP